MGTLKKNFIKGWNAAKRPDEIGSEQPTPVEVVLGVVFFVVVVLGVILY